MDAETLASSIEIVAGKVLADIVEHAADIGQPNPADYPELCEHDWEAVRKQVDVLARRIAPPAAVALAVYADLAEHGSGCVR